MIDQREHWLLTIDAAHLTTGVERDSRECSSCSLLYLACPSALIAYAARIVGSRVRAKDIDRQSSDVMDSFAAPLSPPELEVLHRQQLRLVVEALAELRQRTQIVLEMRWKDIPCARLRNGSICPSRSRTKSLVAQSHTMPSA